MNEKLDYGLLYCEDTDLFYAELMYEDSQWGEVTIGKNEEQTVVTLWDCNFTVDTITLITFIQKVSQRLIDFESSKRE